MRKPIRDTLRPIAERICAELCRWPYIAASQDVLDVICDDCEVMAGLEKIMASRVGRTKAREPDAAAAVQEAAGAHGGGAPSTEVPKKPYRGPDLPPKKQRAKSAGSSAEDAEEKRLIYERLTEYKKQHGRGSLRELARASRVRESVLWDMLDCMMVPMEAWRAVGQALDRLGVGM